MAAFPSTAGDLAVAEEPRLRGALLAGGRAVPAAIASASRLALHVILDSGERLADGAALDGVSLEIRGAPVQLGRGRFLASAASHGTAGRIVFSENLYDCRALVSEGRLVDLRGYFDNVPVVLAQKANIRPEFKEHVAGLAYDLSVYKRFFDEQDRIISDEPHDVAQAARTALLDTEGRRFMAFLDRKIEELQALVKDFTKEEHERHGFYLRRHLWPYILASEMMKRTNLKPRGYAGDAELMVLIYENAWAGASLFSQLMHKHPVETLAAEAVRSRRHLVPRVLRELAGRPAEPRRPFRFLSLACGPACELEDIFVDGGDLERFECALLDQDPHALELARGVVRRIETTRGRGMAVRYHEDSVRTMLRTRDLRQRLGEFELIYSMGLFDYLSTPVAQAVLAKTYDLLAPGGTLLVGNFHARAPTRVHMDYWGDWPLTYRTEASFRALAADLAPARESIEFDRTGCQMFMRLEKPA
jgi:extracellular factor (EF) 3-hydroxypalmitic acid methyl ester biosynthesis protein